MRGLGLVHNNTCIIARPIRLACKLPLAIYITQMYQPDRQQLEPFVRRSYGWQKLLSRPTSRITPNYSCSKPVGPGGTSR